MGGSIEHVRIIGLCGKRNAGKDTVAKMFSYCLNNPFPKFRDYLRMERGTDTLRENCFSFAYYVKQCVSAIFGINVEDFESHSIKDNGLYIPAELRYVVNSDKVVEIGINELMFYSNQHKRPPFTNPKFAIKPRTLLQWFGTEIGRRYIGEDIWVRRCLIDVAKHVRKHKRTAIITDCRFDNEIRAVKNLNKSIIIKVVRPNNSLGIENHESDNDNFDYDFIIENNRSLELLFYKCLTLSNRLCVL